MIYLLSRKTSVDPNIPSIIDEEVDRILEELSRSGNFVLLTDDFEGWAKMLKFVGKDYRLVISNAMTANKGLVFDFDGDRAIRVEDLAVIFESSSSVPSTSNLKEEENLD